MPGALDGIKILDITNYIAGPFATMLLADLARKFTKSKLPERVIRFGPGTKSPRITARAFAA
jgi:crotonobetainyl-CoA:carnitine CoA-transferase CaiB-like acyl-CoA transferase